ncbi:hypothetical protein COO91_09677 (plasmid) [Nostoc flagelliforme CCNUN1]|uniref:Uncharacterized protein n=1 Tax=Nostoc flagelliforme CCNUN1 TaxID=2038116 RepID=A0A2K8T718_9NOSO|nr:hypothetical protein COO91_09677 [Nostoc flagelliforme CCNUN1]
MLTLPLPAVSLPSGTRKPNASKPASILQMQLSYFESLRF